MGRSPCRVDEAAIKVRAFYPNAPEQKTLAAAIPLAIALVYWQRLANVLRNAGTCQAMAEFVPVTTARLSVFETM